MKSLSFSVIFLVGLSAAISHASDDCIYGADLLGSHAVPPNESEAYGYLEGWFVEPLMGANCQLSGPDSAQANWLMHFKLHFIRPLEANVLGVYLGRGAEGETEEILLELAREPLGFPMEVEVTLDPDDCVDLGHSRVFAMVTTSAYPDGEVRGQLTDSCADPVNWATWGEVRATYRP